MKVSKGMLLKQIDESEGRIFMKIGERTSGRTAVSNEWNYEVRKYKDGKQINWSGRMVMGEGDDFWEEVKSIK